MNKSLHGQRFRIILAIALKDSLDALKNRTLLTLAFGILALMLSAKTLPLLLTLRGLPTLATYSSNLSPYFERLQDREDMKLIQLDSEQEMKSLLVDSQQLIIGMLIPNPLDLDSVNGVVQVEAFYPNWANPNRVRENILFFEEVLSDALEMEVQINYLGNKIYPTTETGYHLLMATQTATLMILLVGLILVPYLFLDEKEQHTMEALLVSPAGYNQIVIGKALAGLVYTIIAAVVVLAFNFRYIVHLELLMLCFTLGAVFSVLTGLLLGILVENQASLGLWSSALMFVFIGPSVVSSFVNSRLPDFLIKIFSFTPGVAINQLMKYSMYKPISPPLIFNSSIFLILSILVIFLLLIWRLHRTDR